MSDQAATLGDEVFDYIGAGYPALWVYSHEHEEGVTELRDAIYGDDFPLFLRWDGADGLQQWVVSGLTDGSGGQTAGWQSFEESQDLETALNMCQTLAIQDGQGGTPKRLCVVVLNLHLHVSTAKTAQFMLNYIHKCETLLRQRLVVLSTQPSPTPEILQASFTKLTHKLPGRDQLREILYNVATEEDELPEDQEGVESIVDAARGMTRLQARNCFSLCVRRDGRVTAPPVFDQKADSLLEAGLGLSLHRDRTTTLNDVVGLEHVKKYYLEVMAQRARIRENPRLRPRGIILAGIPGTGKSLVCAALGNSSNRPTLKWRKALTGSKYVSEGAQKTDRVIQICESLAPVNIQVDEGGKAMKASVGSDGGSATQAGEMDSLWLEAHQESKADMYPIFTMNQEVVELADRMPEFLDRFDAVFFLDYPSEEQLDQMWQHHLALYGVIQHPAEYFDLKQRGDIPDCTNWVGRTVDNCARQAALRGRPPAGCKMSGKGKNITPDTIERLREAATKEGWLSAEYEDNYNKDRHQQRLEQAVQAGAKGRDTIRRPVKKKVKKKVRRSSA